MKLKWEFAGEEESQMSRQHVWVTKCGRYRVVRSVSKLSEGEDRYAVGWRKDEDGDSRQHFLSKEGGGNYPREFKSLELALAAAEAHCAERFAEDGAVESNAAQVVKAAAKAKLDRLPAREPKLEKKNSGPKRSIPYNNHKEKTMTVLNVPVESARSLLTKLYQTAGKWDAERMGKKLRSLSARFAEDPGLKELADALEGPEEELLKDVLKAIEEGKRILISQDTPSVSSTTTEEKVKTKTVSRLRKEKTSPNGKSKERGPNIVGTIVDMLRDGPVSKEKISSKLVKLFPQSADNVQVGRLQGWFGYIEKNKGIKVYQTEEGCLVK